MKTLRAALVLFVFAVCISFVAVEGANSSSFAGWAPVTLGSFKEIYTSEAYYKTEYGNQYIKKNGAIDSFSGDDRGVEARTFNYSLNSNYSEFIDTGNGEYKTWDETKAEGNFSAAYYYKIQLRASKSTLSKVDFYGSWFLNPSGIN